MKNRQKWQRITSQKKVIFKKQHALFSAFNNDISWTRASPLPPKQTEMTMADFTPTDDYQGNFFLVLLLSTLVSNLIAKIKSKTLLEYVTCEVVYKIVVFLSVPKH